MSTSPDLTPLDCVLDPSLAPKPLPFVDESGRSTHTIDAVRPSFEAFCGRADDGVVSNGIMVYPPACNDMGPMDPHQYVRQSHARATKDPGNVIEIDVPPLPDKIQMRSFYRVLSLPCPAESCSCHPDPDAYNFTPEEGRRLRMFAEKVCAPHDQYPDPAGIDHRPSAIEIGQAAFDLAKMIHAKYQANREIIRILSR